MIETIEMAACEWRGRVYSVSRPGRHGDVFRALYGIHPEGAPFVGEQGFITSAGRFVDRREGSRIARAAGQLDLAVLARRNLTVETHSTLFSEDIW